MFKTNSKCSIAKAVDRIVPNYWQHNNDFGEVLPSVSCALSNAWEFHAMCHLHLYWEILCTFTLSFFVVLGCSGGIMQLNVP